MTAQALSPHFPRTRECDLQRPVHSLQACHVSGAPEEVAFDGRPARLWLDADLNSFHESYWVDHTTVETVDLVLQGKGAVCCTIYRAAPAVGIETVVRERLDLDLHGEARVPVRLRQSPHGGRLFARLEADGAPLRLSRVVWGASVPPLREVSLGVGICTLNAEGSLRRSLERLLNAGPEAGVDELLVVNRGERIRSGLLAEITARAPRLRLLDQADLGGSDGRVRAAMELLSTPTTTHVLLMDDDVEVDPAHLAAAAAFLRYSRARLVLGGQMLDLFDRCRMREAGGRTTAKTLVRPNPEQLDLRAHETLQRLAKVSPSHIEGWGFAVIPTEAFRLYGTPLPIFIRGEDVEFGIRLRQAGIPTASLPPVSVRQQPFYARPAGWKQYYDLRNRLIFASLHPEHARLDRASRLAKTLLAMIVRHDHQRVALIRHALTDFLQGPEVLERPAAKHAATPSRLRWKALASTLRLILRYGLQKRDAAARWVAAYPRLVSADDWARRLGVVEQAPPGPALPIEAALPEDATPPPVLHRKGRNERIPRQGQGGAIPLRRSGSREGTAGSFR